MGRTHGHCGIRIYRRVPVPTQLDEWEANSPANLPMSATASRSSAPAEVSAEFFAGGPG